MDITSYLNLLNTTTNITKNIVNYIGGQYNLFPQLGIEGSPNFSTQELLSNQNQLEIKWLDEHIVKRSIEPWKNVTIWYLACIYFNNIPIAILRNTISNEDYFSKTLVINKQQYYYAGYYLQQFVKEDPGPNLEPYDIVGSFSGDINPNIKSAAVKSYDLNNINDKNFIDGVLIYTIQIN